MEETTASTVQEFTLKSGYDGLALSCAGTAPAEKEKARGCVVIIHGMAEHKERYYDFMKYLSANGYYALIQDLRGHGKSVRSQEDLGYLYDEGEKGVVEDAVQMVRYARDTYGLPVHLLGHSMGSLIVRMFLQEHDDMIASLSVSGCVSNNPMASMGIFIASVIGLFHGSRYRSPFLNNMAFGAYNKPFQPARTAFDWLNRDEAAVDKYIADPLCGYIFTINGYKALLRMVKSCYSKGLYRARRLNLPVLFISGADDPCHGGDSGFEEAVSFLKDLGYSRVQARLMPGMRHEVLNEIGHEEVYQLFLDHIKEASAG